MSFVKLVGFCLIVVGYICTFNWSSIAQTPFQTKHVKMSTLPERWFDWQWRIKAKPIKQYT